MSIDALKYVKDLRVAPNGEPVALREKAILWYLANAHSEEKRCAWPSNSTIAAANNISARTVQEILKECVRKLIVWRRETFRENGSKSSNEWRFNAIDGDPTVADQIVEETRRIRGELMAGRANAIKKRSQISTEACGSMREPSHGACAESRATPREIPQDHAQDSALPSAEDRATPCAESRATMREIPRDQNFHLTPIEDSQNTQGAINESSGELSAAAAVDQKPAEPNPERDGDQLLDYWILMLTEMAQSGQIEEKLYLRMCVETTQLSAGEANGLFVIRVGVSSARLIEQYVALHRQFNVAARMIGLDPSKTRLEFESIEKVRRA